ncbi:MAG: hypothetical protein IKG93_11485 [Clostridiales bacterium]|nr:hypothetical protein [Clostridiales bacterium]
MINYLYNSRDIAAYFKWAGVSSHQEKEYLHYIFLIGKDILARPLTREYDSFETAVYRDLYYLWSEGFENEFSDIATIAPRGSVSLICDQEFICLESYMKLLALHLIFSRNLPYVHVNFYGLMLPLGLKGEFSDYEKNVVVACETLHLVTKDVFGKPFDLHLGIPDEVLCLSLEPSFRETLSEHEDFRKSFIRHAASRLAELKLTSKQLHEKEEKKKARILKRKLAREEAARNKAEAKVKKADAGKKSSKLKDEDSGKKSSKTKKTTESENMKEPEKKTVNRRKTEG